MRSQSGRGLHTGYVAFFFFYWSVGLMVLISFFLSFFYYLYRKTVCEEICLCTGYVGIFLGLIGCGVNAIIYKIGRLKFASLNIKKEPRVGSLHPRRSTPVNR